MGKGTDKLYITHSEWSSSDAYSPSVGANASSRKSQAGSSFRQLPFNFCAASLQPFKDPVCTPCGTIFDAEVIGAWLRQHPNQNPVNGKSLREQDLIKLKFARNAESASLGAQLSEGQGDLVDPVTFKVFTDNTHIVAIRHGSYANVFAWETVERMNIKAKMWQDLLDDEPFTRADIITLQDPQNAAGRNLSQFKYLQDGLEAQMTKEQQDQRSSGDINSRALGNIGAKMFREKVALSKAGEPRREGPNGAGGSRTALAKPAGSTSTHDAVQNIKKAAKNSATYTTGKAAASFTSTGLTPETSGERAILTDEEYMLKPRRVKHKGYARMETNIGDLVIELQTETAPKAVWNFVKLAQRGYYRGVAFHRNIPNFMIQGGDPSGTGKGGSSIWGKYFNDEFDSPLTHDARGIVSMANKGKNTNSSQFFITYKPTPHLDRKHTIFGKIESGMDVLSRMEGVPVDDSNRPLNKIYIKDIVVFVNPFEEFQKQKREQERRLEEQEEIRRQGGTEDDKTTWTGKRIRKDGTVESPDSRQSVGKYLKAAPEVQDSSLELQKSTSDMDAWEGPVRKKAKFGGFGNFDNW